MIKETVTVRPKFKLSKADHKSLLRTCKIMGISMSVYVRQSLKRRLDGKKYDMVDE